MGARLRAAREAQGMSMADLAQRTRVTQRFLEAIEADRLDLLPSSTYASGFARAHARAVGLDQAEIGHDIRAMVAAGSGPVRQHRIEEIADPARAPSRGMVIVALGVALAVLVLGGLYFATGVFRGTGMGAPETTQAVAAATPAAAPAAVPSPAAATNQVVLTATDEVWMRIYDGADQTLYLGTMKPGERFAIPAGAQSPQINVGRPDKLTITVGGQAVAALGDGRRAIKDVSLTPDALRARGPARAEPLVAPGATPGASPSAAASPAR
ncbi:helix-turn-helix domain-containing protein [Sphingomonas sp. Leaf412]|uniref:helix-turn-helix domain-containing protein n=1 Tax=Sphingomonas sp. Leaf412 TaxID=1736370 RepID=UPI00138F0206|nr:helix-turn-helix domain-containing protein [Sphingomonas sp. Leaf412]